MSDTCEVVTVETENGPVDINKSDLTKDHKLFKDEPKKEKPKKEKSTKKGE